MKKKCTYNHINNKKNKMTASKKQTNKNCIYDDSGENTVVKCIRKGLENVTKDTLLNLHYYTTVKQIIFKKFINKWGCIVGETLDGNQIFIQLDGLYHISVANHSPSFPSTKIRKKKVRNDNSLSKIQTNSIKASKTESSEESQNEESILIKNKLSLDVIEEIEAKSKLNITESSSNINFKKSPNYKQTRYLIKNHLISIETYEKRWR